MNHIDSFERHAFTILINANDGEDQLTICLSGRQDRKTAVTIVASSIDSDCEVLVNNKLWDDSAVVEKLSTNILNWTCKGIPPTSAQLDAESEKIDRFLSTLEF